MNGKGAATIKRLPLHRLHRPNFRKTGQIYETLLFGRHFYCSFFEFSAQVVVRTGESSIEASIDWVNPRVPLRVFACILGLNIKAGIDWMNPCVLLRVSVHIL